MRPISVLVPARPPTAGIAVNMSITVGGLLLGRRSDDDVSPVSGPGEEAPEVALSGEAR